MPSVHVRRRSTYSSLGDTDAPSRPTRGRNTASASSRPRADDPATTTSFLNSSNPSGSPRFSSVVYRAARHNSLSHRSHAVSPLSEQGVPHSRTRSYTTGTRPAARDLFGSPSASPNIDLYPSLTRRAPTADVENQQHAQHSYPPEPESEGETDDLMHDDAVVDHLDVIDPGVATVGVLANTANAIIFPPVSIYSRKPVVSLPSAPGTVSGRPASIAAPEEQIDAHVDEILSKRAKFKRILHGVWAFLKTPMGILVGIYGFLVAFWGAAIVLFLLKWINVHNEETQAEWVEISCQIENTLFCITGLGLAPWRILDTYRIAKIWWYKIRTEKLRKKANLPALYDEDDLPDPQYDPNYVHVLSEKEQADLHYQQVKFMHSQTWYRPHGTATHKAFPIDYALAICSLNVGNSIFQAMLAGCMWSMDRFNRPAWTTGSLIPFAFLCGIFSGVLIWRGGQLAKRTAAVEECLREALAARAAGLKDGLAASEGEGEGEGEGDAGEKLVGAGDTPLLPTVFEGSDIRPGPSS